MPAQPERKAAKTHTMVISAQVSSPTPLSTRSSTFANPLGLGLCFGLCPAYRPLHPLQDTFRNDARLSDTLYISKSSLDALSALSLRDSGASWMTARDILPVSSQANATNVSTDTGGDCELNR